MSPGSQAGSRSTGDPPPVILGLDPGSVHTGYGVLRGRGSRVEAIALGRLSTSARTPLPRRLGRLAEEVAEVLDRFDPDVVALEAPFHGINPRSLIVLAQARGVLLAAVGRRSIEVAEYTPAEVKAAVTGNGRADKQQVAHMVRLLLGLEGEKLAEDTSDALAVALCCAQRLRLDRLEGVSATLK